MYRIFISYRRSDSESFSGRLRDRLRAEYGKRSVFMDTSTILGGAKFDEAIAQNLKSCKVFIAVIGKTWLSCKDDAGKRRLDDPGDWVRKEIAQALASDVLVIPVIFGGATMQGLESLPPDLRSLATRHAVPINDADFDSDVVRLIESCEQLVPRPRRWPWLAGAAAVLLALTGGWFYYNATKLDFRGVYVVPGPGFSGSLPTMKSNTRKKKFYLTLSTGGQRLNIQDFTRKSILIVSDSGLDGTTLPQDIAELKTEIAQHFKAKGSNDFDAVATSLSSDPIVVSSLRVRPGAKVNAEIGIAEHDAVGGIVREAKARCEFSIPEAPAVSAPVFYLAKTSSECKPTG